MLLAPRRPQRTSVHVECRGRHEKKTVTNLYSSAFSIGERKSQATENKGNRPFGVWSPVVLHLVMKGNLNCHGVRYFGHSRSDSFDACGLVGETGGCPWCVFCVTWRLSMPGTRRALCSECGGRCRVPGMKLTRHEKSNDDRGTLYLGPQRSRSTLRGGSTQKPCGNRIFEFAEG